jgi:hypothetical protein
VINNLVTLQLHQHLDHVRTYLQWSASANCQPLLPLIHLPTRCLFVSSVNFVNPYGDIWSKYYESVLFGCIH